MGSFNKAAEQLYITSAAVIQQINLMEEHLKVWLFKRTYRLASLWTKIQENHEETRFKVAPFKNTRENAQSILSSLEKDIDAIGGIFDRTMLSYRRCEGLELTRLPFCCAMFLNRRLSRKPQLQLEDLYGENLLVMRKGSEIFETGPYFLYNKDSS